MRSKPPKAVFKLPEPKPAKKKIGRPEVYPFSTLTNVGDSFVIERKGNFNPTFAAVRLNLYGRNQRGKRQYAFGECKFPNLVIVRTK